MEQRSFRSDEAEKHEESRPDSPEYCSALPKDGINNPPENMLKRFLINLASVTAAVVVILVLLNLAANYLTPYIPFRWERRMTGNNLLEGALDAHGQAKQKELRRIGQRLAEAADLPDGMEVSIFYNPRKVENAFATLGGNIIVFDGLFDLLQTEDGLAMVLAHEIMHVKHRDAVKGMMRALGLLLLSAGVQSGGYVDGVVNFGLAGYSREQEEKADLEAVAVLGKVYGHAGGAQEFFRSLAGKVEKRGGEKANAANELKSLGSSHPDTLVRLRRVQEEARRLGVPETGPMTPLPDALDKNKVFIDTEASFSIQQNPAAKNTGEEAP